MNKHTQAINEDMGTLVEDARALFNATSDAAEEKIVEARQRLATALDGGRKNYGHIREKAVEGARAADQAVRVHPYRSMGIAFGVGAFLGFLTACRK